MQFFCSWLFCSVGIDLSGHVLAGLFQSIDVEVSMAFIKVQSWSESGRSGSTASLVDTMVLHAEHEGIAHLGSVACECHESALAAHCVHQGRIFLLHLVQAVGQVGSDRLNSLQQLVFLDDLVLDAGQLGAYGVAEERVEVTVCLARLRLVPVVESTGEHLLGECDEIRRSVQVPVLMSPEFSCATDTSLDFINNHVNAKLQS